MAHELRGHFVNSLHLWSVELFMAFLAVHLWVKFWMAAWRGGRAKTWITGVLAFVASIVEGLTGYLSQQNFDSQWVATNGKDAFNAAGVGSFFNLMNFGQMLLWHVVLVPLSKVASVDPPLADALAMYDAASSAQQKAWVSVYLNALPNAQVTKGQVSVPAGGFGPVSILMTNELTLAQTGALDADLVASAGFYGTDFTKPLLFLEDGTYYASIAQAKHLTGSQWGVTNETGSYPSQPWLWLYQLWYQIGPLSSSPNVDLIAIYLTSAATLLLVLVPFIPGARDIPRWIPVHRLIWRRFKTEIPSRG